MRPENWEIWMNSNTLEPTLHNIHNFFEMLGNLSQ